MVCMHTLYTNQLIVYVGASIGNSLITVVKIIYLQIKLSMFILNTENIFQQLCTKSIMYTVE